MNSVAKPKVICVDLDGTLLSTDTMVELWLTLLRKSFLAALTSLLSIRRGRWYFKDRVASLARLKVENLPVNQELLFYLRTEKESGRRLVLATASHETIAESVSAHFGLFDEVASSTRGVNLKGAAKAGELEKRFGRGGFAYAGDSRADLPVWEAAGSAITVGVPKRLEARLTTPIEARFPSRESPNSAFLRALRPHQWSKNVLVFVPAVTSKTLLEPTEFLQSLAAFVLFSLCASGVYLINDLLDLEADRIHARKRNRPFASGTLPLTWGLIGGVFLGCSVLLGFAISPWLSATLLAYVVLTTLYSLVLKVLPLIDAFALAALYTSRVIAGGVATGQFASIWLLSFLGFVFLSLALLKRFVEVSGREAKPGEAIPRRGYYKGEEQILLVMGVASAFASALVLALYVDSRIAESIYRFPSVLWGLVPLSLFWQCRMWLSATRGYVDDDPIVYASRDWVTWTGLGCGAVFYAAAGGIA